MHQEVVRPVAVGTAATGHRIVGPQPNPRPEVLLNLRPCTAQQTEALGIAARQQAWLGRDQDRPTQQQEEGEQLGDPARHQAQAEDRRGHQGQ